MRLRFWLLVMDLLGALGVGGCIYLWALRRASDATDWGEANATGEGPF